MNSQNIKSRTSEEDSLNNQLNVPELVLAGTYIENSDAGVGTYFYGNLYLPNISKKIKTVIHNIEFEYKSFNIVKVKIEYQNHVIENQQSVIYSEQEQWKAEPLLDQKLKNLLPFVSVFLPDAPQFSYDKIDIFSKMFAINLMDDTGHPVEEVRKVNQIIFHPDSYFKLLEYPKKNDKKYKVFAGHNVTFFVPLDNKKYTLEFCILNYDPIIDEDEIISNIPILFCSMDVEIKNFTAHWKNECISTVNIYEPAEFGKPVNWDDPQLPSSIPRFKLSNYENSIVALPSLAGRIFVGPQIDSYSNGQFLIKGIRYSIFQHRLKLNAGLNFSLAPIDCPIPSAFYELLQKNPNVILPPVTECFIYNSDSLSYDLKIATQINNLSSLNIKNLRIEGHKFYRIPFLPNFNHEKISNLLDPTDFTVLSQITDTKNNQLLIEESGLISFLPYDTMLIKMIDESTGRTQTFYKYLTSWVRRFKSDKLNNLLRNAIEETFDKIVSGYDLTRLKWAIENKKVKDEADYTRHLVKAIYNSLALLSPRYMNETFDLGRNSSQLGQKIKYPDETLDQERGNCIDFTILFAYLIEAMGLNPIIVIVPKHAYIGWETWSDSGKYEYLETTMVGYNKFEEAFSYGMKEEAEFSKFDYNKAYKIDVRKCHKEGIYSFN